MCQDPGIEAMLDGIRTLIRSLPLCRRLHNSAQKLQNHGGKLKMLLNRHSAGRMAETHNPCKAIHQQCDKCLQIKYLPRLVPVLGS